ncbi:hypothetical protein EDD91_0166 [Streptomyces sp. KS 21]|nr:hypothetical protein EDD91_0166 [Streptomyces sp. KS 21]
MPVRRGVDCDQAPVGPDGGRARARPAPGQRGRLRLHRRGVHPPLRSARPGLCRAVTRQGDGLFCSRSRQTSCPGTRLLHAPGVHKRYRYGRRPWARSASGPAVQRHASGGSVVVLCGKGLVQAPLTDPFLKGSPFAAVTPGVVPFRVVLRSAGPLPVVAVRPARAVVRCCPGLGFHHGPGGRTASTGCAARTRLRREAMRGGCRSTRRLFRRLPQCGHRTDRSAGRGESGIGVASVLPERNHRPILSTAPVSAILRLTISIGRFAGSCRSRSGCPAGAPLPLPPPPAERRRCHPGRPWMSDSAHPTAVDFPSCGGVTGSGARGRGYGSE